jgi:hypothetical protein
VTCASTNRGGAERDGFSVYSGINATDDAFYAGGPEWISQLSGMGVGERRDEELRAVRGGEATWTEGRNDMHVLQQPC